VKSLLPNRHRIWLASISPFGAKLRLQVPEGRNVIAFAPDRQCVGATGVSTPSSCRTRCRTRRGLAPCGKRDGGIGRIAARMSKSSAPTSFRPRSPGSGISATIPIRSSTIPMPGPTSRPSSATEDLFYDYRTNVAAYPTWQAYLREQPPPLLVLGGQVRSILYRRGGVGSPAGCQGRGNPCPRGRPLRHGYEERRGVSPCIEVPRPASPLASKAGRVRAGLERARHANAWRAFCLQAP